MASTSVQRIKLSGSTDGKAIKVAATATLGTTIHTAQSGTTAGSFDEVFVWAYNSDTVAKLLTIEFGGATAPDQNIKLYIPSQTGLTAVLNGQILQNSLVVTAFCETANVVTLTGYVNKLTYA